MQEVKLSPAGDHAILMEFGAQIAPAINSQVAATMQLLEQTRPEGLVDMTPAFCSLLAHYDPRIIGYEEIRQKLHVVAQMKADAQVIERRVFEIPVCYGGDLGPDIENIAKHSGLSVDEVIALHSSCDYLIYMLGFLPGFPYLGGLDERLHTPRLANPRLKISAGSVGIGGSQTGIYPSDSPGGWQLLGMTPVKTYDPRHENPILFRAGDSIRFVPIERAEYTRIAALCAEDSYSCVVRKGGA